ncbi:MAG: hypothetical protein HZB46_02220 [Solirubrobacterales bacterium]|nr:hypothetical protein [Solirubrobacterales bacterium]
MPNNPKKTIAAGAAAVAPAFGAYALGSSGGDDAAAGTGAAAGPQQQMAAPSGQQPQGTPPGFGTPVTGTAAAKVEEAALAKYDGTVERIMQLQDGSYEAHVITSSGEVHVLVSKDYKVTGTETGPPGAGAPPSGAAPSAPQGSAAPSGTTSS